MPQSVLSIERLRSLVPTPLSPERLDELLFASKAEVVEVSGDGLTISATPDRLDLLSEGGLSLYLQGVLDVARGIPTSVVEPPARSTARFDVDPSVNPVRPSIAGALLRAPPGEPLDAGTLAEAIRVQELLHATLGRDRRAASLGIYPWELLDPPIRYSLEPISSVSFVPLGGETEVDGATFFADHPMASKYGSLGRVGDRCLVLRDRQGAILSLPPILNGRAAGEARVGDRELLVEATGRDPRSVREAVGGLLVVFASRGWSAEPVAVVGPGDAREDGRSIVAPHPVELPASLVSAVVGDALAGPEVVRRLERSRLSVRSKPHGWHVEAPPWRTDLLSPVDLAEEVYLAAPVLAEHGVVPPSLSRGRRAPELLFRRGAATRLLGLGFSAPHTTLLASSEIVRLVGGPEPIRLLNPVSAEYAYLRDRLLLSHLETLGRNTRHGYPQRFGEMGPVVVRSAEAESGGLTRYRLGFVVADDSAGFADVAALVDALLRGTDVSGVREPTEIPGTIPGRAARLRITGEVVAEMGEVHPSVLTALGVPVPAAWAELDLTALWPLVAAGPVAGPPAREGP